VYPEVIFVTDAVFALGREDCHVEQSHDE